MDRERKRLFQKAMDPVAKARAIAHLADHPSEIFFDRDGEMWFLVLSEARDRSNGDPVLRLRLRSG